MQIGKAGRSEFLIISLGRQAILWSLFFLICMGLGYPALNRYDARAVPGLYDTRAIFSACGPLLSLSVSLLLVENGTRKI